MTAAGAAEDQRTSEGDHYSLLAIRYAPFPRKQSDMHRLASASAAKLQQREISLKSRQRLLPRLLNEPMPPPMTSRAKMLRLKQQAIKRLAPAGRG
jgi:hypothetical protein